MSDRGNDSLDARIDAALRAIVAADERPVDLQGRVLAAIDARQRARRAPGRARRVAFPDLRLRPRPALGLALAALLAVVVVTAWPALHREPAPLVSERVGTVPPTSPSLHGGAPAPAPSQGSAASPAGPSDGNGAHGSPATAPPTNDGRRIARFAESWDAALPPLDPPEPIELHPLEAPPARVAELEVEQLSIDPLEVDALDGSEEE